MHIFFALLFVLFVSPESIAEVDSGGREWSLKVGRYFDGTEFKNAEHPFLVIKGKRLLGFQKNSRGTIIDVSSQLVLPGLVDGHTHLLFRDESLGENFGESIYRMLGLGDERRLALGRLAGRELLGSGVTTAIDLGNSGNFLDAQLSREAEKDLGLPHIIFAGPGVTNEKAQFSPTARSIDVHREYSDSKRSAQDLISERVKYGATWLKLYADNEPGVGNLSSEELKEFVDKAKLSGLKVAIHAATGASIDRAIGAGPDVIHHAFTLDRKQALLMAQKKIALCPTDFNSVLRSRVTGELRQGPPAPWWRFWSRSRLEHARDTGVAILFGSDAYFSPGQVQLNIGEQVINSLMSYLEQGLTVTETLRTATGNYRSVLAYDFGAIAPGLVADILVVNPKSEGDLTLIKKPVMVIKDGSRVRLID